MFGPLTFHHRSLTTRHMHTLYILTYVFVFVLIFLCKMHPHTNAHWDWTYARGCLRPLLSTERQRSTRTENWTSGEVSRLTSTRPTDSVDLRGTEPLWYFGLKDFQRQIISLQVEGKLPLASGLTTCQSLGASLNFHFFLIFLLKLVRSSQCAPLLAWWVTLKDHSKHLATVLWFCWGTDVAFAQKMTVADPLYHHRAFRPPVASWKLWTLTIWMADCVKHLLPLQALLFLFIDVNKLTFLPWLCTWVIW